jgi:hypothetical protein
MKNKRKLIYLFLTLSFLGVLFYYFRFIEKEEKIRFEERLRNGVINFYCPLKLTEGKFKTDNVKEFCSNSNLFSESLEIKLLDSQFITDSYGEKVGLGLYEMKRRNYSPRYRLIAIKKDKQFLDFETEKKLEKIEIEDGFIVLDHKYRLVDNDRLEKVIEGSKNLTSPDYGFSVKIPQDWISKNIKNGYSFYHPKAKHSYPITLSLKDNDFNIFTSQKTPYKKELKSIKDSLVFNSYKDLPDYTFYKKGLENYFEIDTVNKKINYYKNSLLTESFNVWATGSPYNWQGTPGGLYNVISKEGLRFSSVSQVYMPFSVRIYGKYLIHGEPYYPSGVPYISDVSGGCVRVRNTEMEKLYELIEEGIPVLSITDYNREFLEGDGKLAEFPIVSADSFLVADLETGKVFAGKNTTKKRSIASVTKMMTAIIATEQLGITDNIRIRDYMLEEYGETEGLSLNRRVRLVDLLNPLLIPSSNDAALILAHYLGRDSTLEKMNEKAKRIGMENSSFSDFSGFQSDNISTAEDLYYLAYYLANTRIPLLKITKGEQVPGIDYNAFPNYKNKNLFYEDSQFLGGKTGFTNNSKYTGFFIFNLDFNGKKRRVVFVLLGTERQSQLKQEVLSLKKWLTKAYN